MGRTKAGWIKARKRKATKPRLVTEAPKTAAAAAEASAEADAVYDGDEVTDGPPLKRRRQLEQAIKRVVAAADANDTWVPTVGASSLRVETEVFEAARALAEAWKSHPARRSAAAAAASAVAQL